MIPHLFFYQLVLLGLLWLFFMPPAAWPRQGTATQPRPVEPILPPRKRSSDPKPFPGLTRKPPCAACERMQQPQGDHLTGPEVGLGVFGHVAPLLIDLVEQRDDKIPRGHAALLSWEGCHPDQRGRVV